VPASPAYLILLLPLAWLLVLVVRWFMGSGFKSRDAAAKDDLAAMGQWQAKQEYGRQRMQEGKKALAYQDEHMQRNEQVFPVHESKTEHLKKEFHVGEEKETHYPEIRGPEIKGPETHKAVSDKKKK
jgi:hypothetical protein